MTTPQRHAREVNNIDPGITLITALKQYTTNVITDITEGMGGIHIYLLQTKYVFQRYLMC